jgi:hypothetical protein
MAGYGYGISVSGSRTSLVSGGVPSPPSPILNGLLAYWKLDNNGSGGVSLLDSAEDSRTLTAPNGTGGVSLGTGIINGSASFSGDNQTYFTRDGGFLDGDNDEYSISAWVKTTLANDVFIVDQATGNNWSGSAITLDMFSDGRIYGTIFWSGEPEYDRAEGSTPINNGNWHHTAFTWKRTGSLKVYVDGALDGSLSSSGNYANSPTNNLSINSNADGSFAKGRNVNIDEVGIWNKELSASEITSLYNAGAGKSYPFN